MAHWLEASSDSGSEIDNMARFAVLIQASRVVHAFEYAK